MTLQARRDLDLAPDHRTGFEMAMLRLLAFRPVSASDDPPTLRAAGPAAAVSARPAPAGAAPSLAAAKPVAAVAAPAPAAVIAAPVPSAPPATVASASDSPWFDLIAGADLRGPARELAAQLKPIERTGLRWRVALPPHLESMNTPFAFRALEQAVRQQLGAEASVEIIARVMEGGETLAERTARARAERSASAERELLADPGLQSLTRELGARVVPGSLQIDS
jgi:DNA polymerase-3 subunit gamma/tau